MKKFVVTSLFLVSFLYYGLGQELSKESREGVAVFIQAVKTHDKKKIADGMTFPFGRDYPIPTIKTREEFYKRYQEIFDDSLTKMIANSSPAEDWVEVGWRGISFSGGQVWLDDEGRLVAVNYQSKAEKAIWNKSVALDKSRLHESVRNFVSPIYILETSKYRIRIDDLGNGNYRYASWLLKNKMSDDPDVVIEHGEFISEGSGGNHTYEFKNGDYTYDCAIIIMGEDDTPAMLSVSKGDKTLLTQKARIVVN